MRIAHVLRRLSFDDWGGTEQVVWNIAKAQKEAGHDVRLFATTALWKPELAGTDPDCRVVLFAEMPHERVLKMEFQGDFIVVKMPVSGCENGKDMI